MADRTNNAEKKVAKGDPIVVCDQTFMNLRACFHSVEMLSAKMHLFFILSIPELNQCVAPQFMNELFLVRQYLDR